MKTQSGKRHVQERGDRPRGGPSSEENGDPRRVFDSKTTNAPVYWAWASAGDLIDAENDLAKLIATVKGEIADIAGDVVCFNEVTCRIVAIVDVNGKVLMLGGENDQT